MTCAILFLLFRRRITIRTRTLRVFMCAGAVGEMVMRANGSQHLPCADYRTFYHVSYVSFPNIKSIAFICYLQRAARNVYRCGVIAYEHTGMIDKKKIPFSPIGRGRFSLNPINRIDFERRRIHTITVHTLVSCTERKMWKKN